MRILQLCHKFPYPLKDGAAIAITYLARAFAELGHEVNLLAMNTSKHWFDPAQLPAHFDHYTSMHTVFVDNRIRPWPAFVNLFTSESYHIERFDNPDVAQKLSELLKSEYYDVVQLESLYLTPYVPIIRRLAPKALVVLRAHNVEHEIWERVATNANPLKKWYLDTITPRLKAYEIAHLNDYDLVLGITERDLAHFRRFGLRKPAVVTPIGLDCRDYRPDEGSFRRPLSLSFIGSLDWMPNQEGLRWFLDEVWLPVLVPAFPELTFHIAGRTAPRWLQQLQMERVTFHGEVPDAAAFINQHSVMVVPLLSGGGMRAKILEGMAVGKVVLSTRIGMEGIEARHHRECLLADTAEEIAEAIHWCYAQGPDLVETGRRAWSFCGTHFDNLEVARLLVEKYREMQTRANVPVL